MIAQTAFAQQVTADMYIAEVFYIASILAVMLGVTAVILIDAGLVQPKNVIDTIVQKLLCAFIGGTAFMIVGYGIWNWQFYEAAGTAQPLTTAIKDWWIGGAYFRAYGPQIDPDAVPQADLQQLFAAFFFTFGGLIACFLHGAGVERMKPQASFAMAAIGSGLILPIVSYLSWGSGSFLTNAGLHDFVGAFSPYLLVGISSLILAWRLGPRTKPGPPGNFTLVGLGTLLLLSALPLIVVGCGYLIPGKGYFGITGSQSGLGIVFLNVFMAFGGGAVSGAILAYWKRNPSFAVLGPASGYICCTALFDLVMPWQAFLVALPGPLLLYSGFELVKKLGLDEPKTAPLTILPATYSIIMTGVVGNGRPAGGVMGISSGAYAHLHTHISIGQQLLGLAVMVPIIAGLALSAILLIEKTFGLRVTPERELEGLDSYWTTPSQP